MPLASDPCQGDLIGERPFAGDPASPLDVAAWRHDERQRLRAERALVTPAMRASVTDRIAATLDALLSPLDPARLILGATWPITGEPDLIPWLTRQHDRGVTVTLSVAENPPAPLRFRRFTPGQPMEKGLWDLPIPLASAAELRPNLLIVPVLGWDGTGHRIGFGTGYFDRTLAALQPGAFAIGVGLQSARLSTIHPLPHDRPLDLIVTEMGVQAGSPPVPDAPLPRPSRPD